MALAIGVAFYIWSIRSQGKGTCIAKYFGIVVIVLALFHVVSLSYHGIQFWRAGYYENTMQMMHKPTTEGGVENKSMMNSKEVVKKKH